MAWGFWLVLVLSLPAWAQLEEFEAALEEARIAQAQRIVEKLPAGPVKSLARAQLGFASQHPEWSYPALDNVNPAELPPRLRAKYLLLRAQQQGLANRHGPSDKGQLERLLSDGLASQPSPYDQAELLRIRLVKVVDRPAEAEPIVARLFEISPSAGFNGRLILLRLQEHRSEALALCQVLEQQALSRGKTELAHRYRLEAGFLLMRMKRAAEATESLQSTLQELLAGNETYPVPSTLSMLNWAYQEREKKPLSQSVFDDTVKRLGAGEPALRSLHEATSAYPEDSKYYEQGAAMAHQLGLPLVEASFLLRRAERKPDEGRSAIYRQQARDLLRGHDLRGVEVTWYGYNLGGSLFASGLDTDDDGEIWGLYQTMLESGRSEGEIAENYRALFVDIANRRAAWLWTRLVFEDVLARTSAWSRLERSRYLVSAISRLQHSWITPRRSGQASTYAPREATLAAALGADLARSPELIEDVLAGLAEAERSAPRPDPAAGRVAMLAETLAFTGRYEEAADLFSQDFDNKDEKEKGLLRWRALAELTSVEHTLGRPAAADHLDELASVKFSTFSSYDQPWRRATELAWLYLDKGRPIDSERLARGAIEMAPKNWTPTLLRRLGAHEALAIALTEQGRTSEVETLLSQWEEQWRDQEGARWLATLRTELLLQSGQAREASLVAPPLVALDDEATSIYLANLHRRIAQALDDNRTVIEMEEAIAASVDRMVRDWPELRQPLLASPAYADFPFLRRDEVRPPESPVVRGNLVELEKVIEKLERLRVREPDSQALAQLSATRVRAMAQAAGPDQVIVQPILLSHSVVMLAASEGEVSLCERFVDVDALHRAIDRLAQLAGDESTSPSRLESDGDYLALRLLQPWRAEFPGRHHLLWLAEGKLKELPLTLLRLDGKNLLESMSVVYLDGPGSVQTSTFGSDQSALLIGGSEDLPGAAQELAEVRALLPRGESWRLGQDFSLLQELAVRHRLVHVASHGLPPTKGRLGGELSGSAGSLSAFQLADLHFAPDTIVVASACQVGTELRGGPGDSTVLNALRTAGASSVLGSPWLVDDETSRVLVLSFYRHLLKGAGPAVALAKAQLEVRKTHPHPFHWAGARILSGPSQTRR